MSQNERHRRPLAELAWRLLAISLIARLASVGSQLIIGMLYGTSATADVFYFAQTFVTSTQALIVSITATFAIISIVETSTKEGELAGRQAADNLFTYSVTGLLIIGSFIFTFAPWLCDSMANFPPSARGEAIRALRLLSIAGTVSAVSQILIALHNAERKFVVPSALAILQPVTFVGFVWVSRHFSQGVAPLASATAASAAITVAILIGYFDKAQRPSINFRLSRAYLRSSATRVVPLLISQVMASIWMITGRGVVSGLATGSLSALTYAERLRGLFLEFLVTPLAPLALRRYSESFAMGDVAEAWKSLQRGVAGVWFAIVPAICMVWVVGDWFVGAVFERGAFTTWSTQATYLALRLYVVGLWAEAAHYLVSRFYIAGDRVLAMTVIGVPATAVYLIGATMLSSRFGLQGVAFAYSAMTITSHVLSVAYICIVASLRPSRWFANAVFKIGLSSVACLAAMSLLRMAIGPFHPSLLPRMSALTGVAATGAVVYGTVAHLTGLDADIPWLRASLVRLIPFRGERRV